MGFNCYAHTVIGVQLPLPKNLPRARISVRKKAFDHNYKDEDGVEFDLKTGRKLWLNEKIFTETDYPVIVYESDYEDSTLLEGQVKLTSFPQHNLAFLWGTDNSSAFFGMDISSGSLDDGYINFNPVPDIENIKQRLKEVLEPFDLWKESDFGIYTILVSSY
jgi:hypothetical protein